MRVWGAAAGIEVGGGEEVGGGGGGDGEATGEGVAQLLAFLAEAGAGDAEESGIVGDVEGLAGVKVDTQDGAVDFGARPEGGWIEAAEDAGHAVELDAEGQQAEAAGACDEAFGDFLLEGEDEAARVCAGIRGGGAGWRW